MAKNIKVVAEKPAETEKQSLLLPFRKFTYRVIFWAVFFTAAVALWKNPQIINQIRSYLQTAAVSPEPSAPSLTLSGLNERFSVLQNEFETLKAKQNSVALNDAAAAKITEKMDALEKNNLNIIDSKADVATVLGLINRLDKIEEKVDTLSRFTDESALILTAVMLVKDSAERGGSFDYETEILQEIAAGNTKVKPQIDIIAKYARLGIKTNSLLVNEFESIYKALLKQQKETFAKNWKDRLNSKLSEIIVVKRVDEKTPEFEADQGLELVRKEVEAGNLSAAVKELQQPQNQNLLKDAALAKWLSEARANVEFNEAIAQISTRSLAIMKVNFIKKETKHD